MIVRRRLLLAIVWMLPSVLLALSCGERSPFSFDFEEAGILDQLGWTCRTLYRLSADHATSGTRSLEVTFFPAPPEIGSSYPGVTLPAFDPDWTGRRSLVFDVYNPEDKDLRLTLRIDDRRAPAYPERLNRGLTIAPGANHISIPLSDLVTSGSRRPLNLANILRLSLFMANPRERHTLYLDWLRVE